jgi:hypothetical protein
MPMQLQDDQPLEIVFGIREDDHIRFEVLGLTCPEADTDWYRSQLDVEIRIHVGSFRGYRSLVMVSDDFHLFRAALKRLLSGETEGAWLDTGDFLSVEVSADGNSYNAWMQLDALERDGEMVLRDGGTENWEWRLAITRTSLDTLVAAVIRISERYPTWSVPKS